MHIGGSATAAAKVQKWSFSMNQAVIETTSMGDPDRTLKDGIRSYSGSARLFYYTTGSGSTGGSNIKAILENSIRMSDSGVTTDTSDGVQTSANTIKLKLAWLDGDNPRLITFWVYVTGLTMGASMGEVSSVDITWEANGAPVEDTLATGQAYTGS